MKTEQRILCRASLWVRALAAVCLLGAAVARADFIYHVTLDTSALIGHAAGPFSVEFQFNDGVGTGDANNFVSLSNFGFGGGAAGLSAPITSGGGAGDLLTGQVLLTDTSFFNDFIQEFNPGSALSFDVHQTTAVDPGPQPDQFSFSILDCSSIPLPTQGPADALLTVDVTGDPPLLQTFAGDPSRLPSCGGPGIPMPAPQVSSVPEDLGAITPALSLAAIMIAGSVRSARQLSEARRP